MFKKQYQEFEEKIYRNSLVPSEDIKIDYNEADFSTNEYKELIKKGNQITEQKQVAYVIFSSWMFKRAINSGPKGSGLSIFSELDETQTFQLEEKICQFMIERVNEVQEQIGSDPKKIYLFVKKSQITALNRYPEFANVTPLIIVTKSKNNFNYRKNSSHLIKI